jgi:hypothetical protein
MKKPLILHPFLFGLYPVVHVYSSNRDQLDVMQTIGPTLFIVLCVILFWCIFSFLHRCWNKGATSASILINWFFWYSFVYGVLCNAQIFGIHIGWHRYLLPAWTVLWIGLWIAVLKIRKDVKRETVLLNVIGGFLVICTIIFLFIPSSGNRSTTRTVAEEWEEPIQISLDASVVLPNIYFIVLDEHVGPRFLVEDMKYDCSHFVNGLENRGYYIASSSQSNYGKTDLSLPATMNMKHVSGCAENIGSISLPSRDFAENLHQARILQLLKGVGYTTVALKSNISWTEMKDADVYLSTGILAISEYTSLLLANSPADNLCKALTGHTIGFHVHRWHITGQLAILEDLLDVPAPYFVFAHVLCPHSPYVFGEEGEYPPLIEPWNKPNMQWDSEPAELFKNAYLSQISYLDKRILEVVDGIKNHSSRPTVIILQGDHGIRWGLDTQNPNTDSTQDLRAAFSVLNAIYLPNCSMDKILYDSISPINTFRVILNQYFGTKLPMLEDTSWISSDAASIRFNEVKTTFHSETNGSQTEINKP